MGEGVKGVIYRFINISTSSMHGETMGILTDSECRGKGGGK